MAYPERRLHAPRSRPVSAYDDDDYYPATARLWPSSDNHKKKRRARHRGHSISAEKQPSHSTNVTLTLAVYHGSRNHSWRTTPVTFDRARATDRQLWSDIRNAYRTELQREWRRVFQFTRLKHIVPIEVCSCEVFILAIGTQRCLEI